MSVPQHVHDEIRRLLWAVRDGELSSDDAAKLCSLLTDPEARELYVWYSYLCGSLQWDHSARKDEFGTWMHRPRAGHFSAQCHPRNRGFRVQNSGIRTPLRAPTLSGRGAGGEGGSDIPHPSSFIIHHSPPIHYPLSTIDSFVGGMLFSYLVAAVIVSVGLLIGAFTYVSQPERQVGWDKRSDVPPAGSYAKHAEPVGQITGMVDCQWKNDECRSMNDELSAEQWHSSFILHPSSFNPVSLGDKFALASGLMEITYDTGARVILQGPVTYEVEANGGYLSVGKLTGKLEKEGRRRR